MKRINILTLIALFTLSNTLISQTVTKTLEPAKDNTIFSDTNFIKSNGSGDFIFAGLTDDSLLRRALIQFNLSSIPQSATIDSAILTLSVSKSIFADAEASLYKLSSDWGEGNSDAPGQEGKGDVALTGDATWWDTFYEETAWTNAGGDFVDIATAVSPVPNSGSFDFKSAQLNTDINNWLAAPEGNFGWIILTDETQLKTAKRFYSREFDDKTKRPKLTLYYENPVGIESSNLVGKKPFQLIHSFFTGESSILSQFSEANYRVKIFSITGMEVYNKQVFLSQGVNAIYPVIDSPGIYLVTVSDRAQIHASKMLIQ